MSRQNKNSNQNGEGDDWEPWQKYHSARRGGFTALGQMSTNPFNFGWFVADVLSGSGCPQSEQELQYLSGIGINHVVTLSPGMFYVWSVSLILEVHHKQFFI